MDSEKKTILIVDDNRFFIQQLAGCLDRQKFDILTADSGKEALELLHTNTIDLILLDHIMEDMTGPDICETLKANPVTAHIPIVIVSSGEREDAREQIARAGCDGIIFKPIRRNQVLALVEEYLGVAFRMWPRARVAIECETMSEGLIKDGMIHSLSGGGAFIGGGLLLLRGDTGQLRFNLPDSGREITVREAMVVWLGQLGSSEIHGTGFQFLTINPDDQEAIDQYVAGKNSSP
jgi:CheY-like chemotaxis protein